VQRALSPSTRAILVVSPNNPTGSILRHDDREWLVELASERGVALISDEVFVDYPLALRSGGASLLGELRALTFTLGGLSKSAGLPQMKLAWIAASGPPAQLREALAHLELIADSYLSVSTPVQLAASRLIDAGRSVRVAVHARLRRNLDALRAAIGPSSSVSLQEPEGGWSAVLRVPAILSEEQMVLMLLAEHSVLVHPGYFFDFTHEAFLIVSLLPEPVVFDEGIARVIGFITGSSR
jgi:aspartate/methionine/tyrosine aminotransferase